MSPILTLTLLACRSPGADPDTTPETTPDTTPADADADGWDTTSDCDDADAAVSPDAEELCDGIDNNCDGEVDEGVLVALFTDTDEDGYGDAETWACPETPGTAAIDGDCDDDEPLASPGQEEICGDRIDNDCDGTANDCAPSGSQDTTAALYGLLGSQEEDLIGRDLAGTVDMDGDGLGEVVVGSMFGSTDTASAGAAFLVRGQPSGESEIYEAADAAVTSTMERDFLGFSVRGGVDLTDDGQRDWVVSAPGDVNRDEALSFEDRGEVLILSGDLTGSGDARELALIHIEGHEAGMHLGTSLALSALGGPTLAVGSQLDSLAEDAGAVYLFSSPLSGTVSSEDADTIFQSTQEGEALGEEVALADINGDGLVDLIAGGTGSTWLKDEERGTLAWLTAPVSGVVLTEDADGSLHGSADHLVGHTLSTGDMDGDGYIDLATTGNDNAAEEAGIYIFSGPIDGDLELSAATATITAADTADQPGASIDMSQDLDGDGKADLLVGSWGWPTGKAQGRAYLMTGPFAGDAALEEARASWGHDETESAFGYPVAFVPDTNGDGIPDIAVGACYTADKAPYGGAAWVFAGVGM